MRVMAPTLRELKKQRTRAAIQEAALRLIGERGYDGTTCEQIAAAAEVSPATFFRYFPTKEDVVVTDDYDPLLAHAVSSRPAREGPLLAVRRGVAQTFALIGPAEMDTVRSRTTLMLSVPALRARMHEQTEAARNALAPALAPRMGREPDDLKVQSLAAACAAALSVGVEHWAAHGGELVDHIDQALAAIGDA